MSCSSAGQRMGHTSQRWPLQSNHVAVSTGPTGVTAGLRPLVWKLVWFIAILILVFHPLYAPRLLTPLGTKAAANGGTYFLPPDKSSLTQSQGQILLWFGAGLGETQVLIRSMWSLSPGDSSLPPCIPALPLTGHPVSPSDTLLCFEVAIPRVGPRSAW